MNNKSRSKFRVSNFRWLVIMELSTIPREPLERMWNPSDQRGSLTTKGTSNSTSTFWYKFFKNSSSESGTHSCKSKQCCCGIWVPNGSPAQFLPKKNKPRSNNALFNVFVGQVYYIPYGFYARFKVVLVPLFFKYFGTGNRRCVGEILARAEQYLFFVSLLQNFRWI